MRYKNNVLDKLTQLETTINRIQIQVNRNVSQEGLNESIDKAKIGIEAIREIVSIEPDDFEQQFRPQ